LFTGGEASQKIKQGALTILSPNGAASLPQGIALSFKGRERGPLKPP